MHQNLQPANTYTAQCFMGHKRVEHLPKTFENVSGNTHISMIRYYETTLQLVRAPARNIICC